MKNYCLLICTLISFTVQAQKYVKESGDVVFFSHTPLEDIKAENKKAASIFNAATGDIAYSVPITFFQFDKALMREHFNEKYLESDKYPKATFQGKITGFDLKKSETQNVMASGKLTIHGVVNDINVPGTFEIRNDKLILQSKFNVKMKDYKVGIPQLMWQNIAEES